MASKTILCPYCFNEFNNTEALYQCESEERNRDGEYECQRVTSDEYDRYWKGEDLPLRYVWPQKSGFLSKLRGPSFDQQKCPHCGYRSRRFVCPHCYNWLPTDMIENGSEIISVIGSPSSGKTNYIVALIQQLRKYGYKMDLQVNPTQVYRDGHKDESTQNLFKKFETQLFKDHTVLFKTAVNKAEIPWIFHLTQQSTGKDIYLVFYDTAGERFLENIKNNAKYLEKSSGVIVLLDVLSVPYIKKKLQEMGMDEFAGKPSEDLEAIHTSLANFEDKNVYQKPFAFVFSKFDAVINNAGVLEFNASAFVNGQDYINSNYIKDGKVNLNEINKVSYTIEQAMDDGDTWDVGNFLLFAQNWCSKKNLQLPAYKRDSNDPDNNYKFFGVSAFGCMPDDSDMLEAVKPYRVMDPLIWILHKLGKFDIPVK